MPISSGTRFGPYEILAPIGAGGMGEVFRARDTRLDRQVAIKVLPAEYAHDAAFRLRFEREAKIISQLNHPHICTLHDVGDGYLVMELIEGESLADRLARGPLPLDQVLLYGAQIAEGLDRAHRRGIVHRDLKPGNIMLTKGGAKLLDFGLAKPAQPSLVTGHSLTELKPITEEGTVIGTFQYMAPEQLEGVEADARTDIFALGAVLYEMATGRRAFEGKTRTSLVAAIVGGEPAPMSKLQPLTPPALERIVRQALAKDPDERWQSAHDIAVQLRAVAEGVKSERPGRRGREALAWSLFAAALLAAGAFVARERMKPEESIALNITANGGTTFAAGGLEARSLSISPNGRYVTFSAMPADGRTQLWVRDIRAPLARALPGTDRAILPFWSPDSRFIAFFADGKLKKVSIGGGAPVVIAPVGLNPRSGSWNEEGIILFSPSSLSAIHKVPASGGPVTEVTKLGVGETTHRWATFLPDGRHFLYMAGSHGSALDAERNAIHASSLDGMPPKLIVHARSNPVYSKGHLLYVRDRVLLAQLFDAERLELRGDPVPVADDVQHAATLFRGNFAASDNGTLVYRTGAGDPNPQLAWLDRSGKRLADAGDPARWSFVALSPDGSRAIGQIVDSSTGVNSLWTYDVARNVRTRYSFGNRADLWPVWSRDGKNIVYSTMRDRNWDLFVKPSDGAGGEQLLYESKSNKQATDWSPDGRFVAYTDFDARRSEPSVFILPLQGDRKPYPLQESPYSMRDLRFSPDGKWALYLAGVAGEDPDVYVVPFPEQGGTWQVSVDGARWARWTKEGSEIVYQGTDGAVYAVEIAADGSGRKTGAPQRLFHQQLAEMMDVTAGGDRFLCRILPVDSGRDPLTLITNWTTLLEK